MFGYLQMLMYVQEYVLTYWLFFFFFNSYSWNNCVAYKPTGFNLRRYTIVEVLWQLFFPLHSLIQEVAVE